MLRRSLFLAIALLVTLATTQIAFAEEDAKAKAGITMGDGEANWSRLDGSDLDDRVVTLPEVKSNSDGWLVLHPCRDGKLVGEI